MPTVGSLIGPVLLGDRYGLSWRFLASHDAMKKVQRGTDAITCSWDIAVSQSGGGVVLGDESFLQVAPVLSENEGGYYEWMARIDDFVARNCHGVTLHLQRFQNKAIGELFSKGVPAGKAALVTYEGIDRLLDLRKRDEIAISKLSVDWRPMRKENRDIGERCLHPAMSQVWRHLGAYRDETMSLAFGQKSPEHPLLVVVSPSP